MSVLQTSTLDLPLDQAAKLITQVKTTSTVAALSAREPKRFGRDEQYIKFTGKPRAQFVEEGAAKASSNPTVTTVQSATHTVQVTMRTSNQVRWADEDYQLGVFAELAALGAEAMARALDLGVYHRINPITGTPITTWTNWLGETTNRVPVPATGAKHDELIEAAAGILIGLGTVPDGVALTPDVAFSIATQRDQIGHLLYPELGFGVGISSFKGLRASSSTTVSGLPEATADTGMRAIVGDFAGGILWGVARDFPIEVIEYGDPDNSGFDLKNKNEIALRLEMVYSWYVLPERFAIVGVPGE